MVNFIITRVLSLTNTTKTAHRIKTEKPIAKETQQQQQFEKRKKDQID